MAIFKNRLPSRRETLLVFAVCVAVVYSWSLLKFSEKLPSWLLHVRAWDILGIFAYTQGFALLESGLVLLVLLGLAAVLPPSLLRQKFAAQGGMVVLLSAAWAVAVHYNDFMVIRNPTRTTFFLWSGLYLASLLISYLLIRRYHRLEAALTAFMERLTVLVYVYVPLSLLSLAIVLIRGVMV